MLSLEPGVLAKDRKMVSPFKANSICFSKKPCIVLCCLNAVIHGKYVTFKTVYRKRNLPVMNIAKFKVKFVK